MSELTPTPSQPLEDLPDEADETPSINPGVHAPIDDWGQPDLVTNRPNAYRILFDGELPYETEPAKEDIGLSGLLRAHTHKGGSPGDELEDHLSSNLSRVREILLSHQIVSGPNGPAESNRSAIFHIIDKDVMETTIEITTEAFRRWEIALYRNGEPYLLGGAINHGDNSETGNRERSRQKMASSNAEKSLVVEAAAAVLEVLPIVSKNPKNPTRTDIKNLVNGLSNWGPKFLKEWFNGDIIAHWCKDKSMTDEQMEYWLKTFNPSIRKLLMVNNIRDPLGALDKIRLNLTETLTIENIESRLRLGEEQLAEKDRMSDEGIKSLLEIFTPGIIKQLAVDYITDPLDAVDRVKHNYTDLLSDESITNHLRLTNHELTQEQIESLLSILSPSARAILAVNYIANPLKAVDKIIYNLTVLLSDDSIESRLRLSEEKQPEKDRISEEEIKLFIKDVFSPGVRNRLAMQQYNDPVRAVDKIIINFTKLLSYENIANELGWSNIADVKRVFTPSLRKEIAVSYIGNPLEAIKKYIAGEISYGGYFYRAT